MKQKNTPQPAPQLSQADRDNRSNQLNPKHYAYWQSRGLPEPPESGQTPPSPKTQ